MASPPQVVAIMSNPQLQPQPPLQPRALSDLDHDDIAEVSTGIPRATATVAQGNEALPGVQGDTSAPPGFDGMDALAFEASVIQRATSPARRNQADSSDSSELQPIRSWGQPPAVLIQAGSSQGGSSGSQDTAFGRAWRQTTLGDSAAGPSTTELIFVGIPIEDSGLGKMVRRVILLAATGATFYVCRFINGLMRGTYRETPSGSSADDATSLWTALSSLFIELSIPACGYYGALYSNRQLTCCFCSCNLFITIVSIMSFIHLNIHISEIDGQCQREQNPQQRRTCEVWTSHGHEKYLMLTSTVLIICIGCLAFWFGNTLYNRLAQDFGLTMPHQTALVGEVIPVSSLTEELITSRTGVAPREVSRPRPVPTNVSQDSASRSAFLATAISDPAGAHRSTATIVTAATPSSSGGMVSSTIGDSSEGPSESTRDAAERSISAEQLGASTGMAPVTPVHIVQPEGSQNDDDDLR